MNSKSYKYYSSTQLLLKLQYVNTYTGNYFYHKAIFCWQKMSNTS